MSTATLDPYVASILTLFDAGTISAYRAENLLSAHFFKLDPSGSIDDAIWKAQLVLSEASIPSV